MTDEDRDNNNAALAEMFRRQEERRLRQPMSERERRAREITMAIEEGNTITDGKNID